MKLPLITAIGILASTGCGEPKSRIYPAVNFGNYICGVSSDYRDENRRNSNTPTLHVAANSRERGETDFINLAGNYDLATKSLINIDNSVPEIRNVYQEKVAHDILEGCVNAVKGKNTI